MKKNMSTVRDHNCGEPEQSEYSNRESRESVGQPPQIIVPYTTPDLSRAALSTAAAWAESSQATVVLMAVHVVPYPVPLDQPPVQSSFLLRQLKNLVREHSYHVRIELVLSRSRDEALRKLIAPGALVFLATKKRWWRTPEEKLARQLAQHGCRVSLQTFHCEDRDIKLFGFTPGDKPAQSGELSYPHFYHVVRL